MIGSSSVVCILHDRAKKASVAFSHQLTLIQYARFPPLSRGRGRSAGSFSEQRLVIEPNLTTEESLFASTGLNFYPQVLHKILIKLEGKQAQLIHQQRFERVTV